ncbi:MAG: glycosyltransferase family 92 protein [Candidatus Thiodiazotropha sp.]
MNAVSSNISKLLHAAYDQDNRQTSYDSVKSNGIIRNLPIADQQMENMAKWQRNLGQSKNVSERQFYLSAVVRVRLYNEDKARWTVSEFKQWLHYQFWAGAEHIYICNHFLNETENLEKPLEKYIALGLVTLFSWNHINAIRGSKTYSADNANNQDSCYQHVLEKYRNQSVWQYNFDMDENPYCPSDQTEGFLARFLRNISESEKDKPQSKQTVDIRVQNFILHGQGDRTRNTAYDRINRITPHIANGNWKTIYKPKFVDDIGMHGVKKRHGKMVVAEPRKLKMLHYWGARVQQWGPDTPALKKFTVEFNDVRNTIAVSIRNSLLAMNEIDAFSCYTGP